LGYSSTWFRKIEQMVPGSPMAWHLPSKPGTTPGNEDLRTNTLLFSEEEYMTYEHLYIRKILMLSLY